MNQPELTFYIDSSKLVFASHYEGKAHFIFSNGREFTTAQVPCHDAEKFNSFLQSLVLSDEEKQQLAETKPSVWDTTETAARREQLENGVAF